MEPDGPMWVVDTSVYTHLARAGHAYVLERLAPSGIVLVPTDVDREIKAGQEVHADIPDVGITPWARLVSPSEAEEWTQLEVKAALGGTATDNLGECAVIAVAKHRGMTALLDDRAAIAQADLHQVAHHDTLWLVVEAHFVLFGQDRGRTIKVVDDLIGTGMYLPIESGDSLFVWAWENGWLPRD